MKFIFNAQQTLKIAKFLRERGFDVDYTLNLPVANATSDDKIKRIAV